MGINDTFRLNQDFLKELQKRLKEANADIFNSTSGEFIDSPPAVIPSLGHLEEIISGMFWASTQMEEGRLLRFRATYSEPAEQSSIGLDFATPIPWDSEEIRKLAPSVIPPDGRMCVYTVGKGRKLFIKGMESKSYVGEGAKVLFEIIEPARIIVQFPLRKKIAEINGQTYGFIDDEWNRIGFDLMSLDSLRIKISINSSRARNTDNKPYEELLNVLYGNMTQEILSRVRLLRHGGTLIFASNFNGLKSTIESPIKYECGTSFDAIETLERSLKTAMDKERNNSGKTFEISRAGYKALERSQNKARMADAARTVAYLTAVDGATILNRKFEVLAFGAKINEELDSIEDQTVTKIFPLETDKQPTPISLIDAFPGKRHLSTARFVLRNPKSIAFTVSQDGGITGFIMRNGNLLAYKGLELLL